MQTSISTIKTGDFRCIGFYDKIKDFKDLEGNDWNTVICKETQTSWQLQAYEWVNLGELFLPNGPEGRPGKDADPIPGKQGETPKIEDFLPILIDALKKDQRFLELTKGEKGDSIKGDPGKQGESIEGQPGKPGKDGEAPSLKEIVEAVITALKNDDKFLKSITGKQGDSIKGDPGKDGEAPKIEDIVSALKKDADFIQKTTGKKGESVRGDVGPVMTFSEMDEKDQKILINTIISTLMPNLPRGEKGEPFRYEDFSPDQLLKIKANIQNLADTIASKVALKLRVEYSINGQDWDKEYKEWDKFFRINLGSPSEALPIKE